MLFERTKLTRRQLRARLPERGAPGWTAYAQPGEPVPLPDAIARALADEIGEIAAESDTGAALFASSAGAMLVVPPFPLEVSETYSEAHPDELLALFERPRAYAAFLLRLGGFSIGFFERDELVASKTDQRFVKNRNRKGGQSQRRFERIREKQVDELFDKACAIARETLEPHEAAIEHVFLGGDRRTLQAFRKECSYFERFGERLRARVLAVPGDPRKSLLEAIPQEVWSSEVYVAPVGEDGREPQVESERP